MPPPLAQMDLAGAGKKRSMYLDTIRQLSEPLGDALCQF